MNRAEAAAILGVSPTAPAEDIRRAHLSRSRLLHPDRFVGSEKDHAAATAEQARVNVARDVLLDSRSAPGPASFGPDPVARRAAEVHFAAAQRLSERAAWLNRMASWIGVPSLIIFVLSLVSHTALPPIVRPIVIISVVGSFAAAGMARSRHRRAEERAAQGQRLLDGG